MMLQAEIELIASARHAAQRSYRKETPLVQGLAMLTAIPDRALVVEVQPPQDKQNITTAITGRLRTTHTIGRHTTTARRRSSIARGLGVVIIIHTLRQAAERLLLLTRPHHAALIAAEQVQAQTEEPEAETRI